MTMDPNDLSPNFVKDDQSAEDISSTEPESDNVVINLPIPIDRDLNESNSQSLEKCNKEHSVGVSESSRREIQDECRNALEDRLPIGEIGKASASNISLNDESLKISQSMFSFTSTAATCGSSSSGSMSNDDEMFDDVEEISEEYESSNITDLEKSVLEFLSRAVGKTPHSPSTTSLSDIGLANESKATDSAFTGGNVSSLLPEDSNSVKSSEICSSLDAVDISSNAGKFHNSELNSPITLDSNKSSDIEKLSSTKNTCTVPPLSRKLESNPFKRDETSEIVPGCSGSTSGFCVDNLISQICIQKEDKSVRRKVKAGASQSLVTEYPEPPIPSTSKNVGRSLLQITKSVEPTLDSRYSWNNYEIFGRSGEVGYFAQTPWAKELISFCDKSTSADSTAGLDTESLLKEVQSFFKNNRLEADVTLGWEEKKIQIVISKYFSDEFSRCHGLQFPEETEKEPQKNFKYFGSRFRNNIRIQELCKTLIELNISEQNFIEFFKRDTCENTEFLVEALDQEATNNVTRQILWILEETGSEVITALYGRLTREGASFDSIINESQTREAVERFRCSESLSVSQNSGQLSNESLARNQNTSFNDYDPMNQPISQTRAGDINCPSSNEENVSKNGESAAESAQTQSRGPKETSKSFSASDSNVFESFTKAENEPCDEKTGCSARKKIKLESSNDKNTVEDGSNAPVEDRDSKPDGTNDSEERESNSG